MAHYHDESLLCREYAASQLSNGLVMGCQDTTVPHREPPEMELVPGSSLRGGEERGYTVPRPQGCASIRDHGYDLQSKAACKFWEGWGQGGSEKPPVTEPLNRSTHEPLASRPLSQASAWKNDLVHQKKI
eukprot:1161647-Pelagomonas_calceolata.AAC.10